MAQVFGQLRNVELSTIYFLKQCFQTDWNNISVIKGNPNFPSDPLPVVAINVSTVLPKLKEVGSRTMDNTYNIIIDIYATGDGQRLDLAQYVENKILLDWTYYLFSQVSGSPDQNSQVADGKVIWQQFTQHTKVDFLEDVPKFDRFRYRIAFNVRVAKNV